MNFEEAYNQMTFLSLPETKDDSTNRFYHKRTWETCKKEILKIIEDEIDNGDLSIVKAAKKIREEI
jgi:hypothetical protein